MAINRRNFVRLTLLSSGMVFAATPEIKALNSIVNRKKTLLDGGDWIQLMKDARTALAGRDYAEANALYSKAIDVAPDKIQGYDGLKKVYFSQNLFLEAAEVFRIGLKNNPDDVVFVDRMATSLRRLCMGHFKQTSDFINKYGEGQLLEQAAQLYINALAQSPGKIYLQKGLREVQESVNFRKKESEQGRGDFEFNPSVEAEMNSHLSGLPEKAILKIDYSTWSEEDLMNKIDRITTLTRNPLIFEDAKASRADGILKLKKELYRSIRKKRMDEGRWDDALEIAEKISELDETDTDNYSNLKRLYFKTKDYSKLVQISRDKLSREGESFWNHIGLAKHLLLFYYKGNLDEGLVNESLSLYTNLLEKWNEATNEQLVAAYGGMAKCFRIKGKHDEAMDAYVTASEKLHKPSQFISVTVMIGAAKNNAKSKGDEEGLNSLNYLLGNGSTEDVKLKRIKEKLATIDADSKVSIPAHFYMGQLHKNKSNKNKAEDAYKKIKTLQPKDKSADKKLKAL